MHAPNSSGQPPRDPGPAPAPGPAPHPDAAPARGLARRTRRTAWLVALAADALQWVVFPLFVAGGASPFDATLDVVVAIVMVRLLGWHWAFLPSFAAELIPGVNLVPTWTLAVWIATRGRPPAPGASGAGGAGAGTAGR